MNLIRFLKRQINRVRHDWQHEVSYSQCGEDIIIQYVFASMGIRVIRYLDIGAHHPSYLSNTCLFYLKGHRGVCVEPDATLLPAFRRERPGDTLLNIGVAPEQGNAEFFVMTTPTLNTFSRSEAERFVSYGKERIERVEKIPIRNINSIISESFTTRPNLLSLDVEGLDLMILQSLDFDRYAPTVMCVETLTYTEDRSEHKLNELIDFVKSKGYFVYADTYVNSIFVRSAAWRERGKRGAA